LDALLKGLLELVKLHLIKHLLLELQHFSSVKDHLPLWSSFRHDQRTLWEWKLSCRNVWGFLVIHFGLFPSSPFLEQQKQGVTRSHWNVFTLSSFLLLCNFIFYLQTA